MKLEQAYRQVEARLERIDFPALHRGFHPFPFALYNGTEAFTAGGTIQRPDSFLGNTAIEYKGVLTAIWELSEEEPDIDVLTSKIVHEMLHAFQHESGEKRWADERGALAGYDYDPVCISARLGEATLTRQCLAENDPGAFSRVLGLRRSRMERDPAAYDYEARIEQIEGTAHYVELTALGQLDPGKAALRWDGALKELEEPARYFPVRAVTYLSGAVLIACIRKYTDLDTDRTADIPFAVEALEKAEPCPLPAADPRAENCLKEYREKIRTIVSRTLDKGDIVLEGDNRLAAWNVYDSVRDGRYAVLTHFIGYIEGTDLPATDEEFFSLMKIIHGDFVAEIDRDLIMKRLWRQ